MNNNISYQEASKLIYQENDRLKRFNVFIDLYESDLKTDTDYSKVFKIFREAYVASNNIYSQIQNHPSGFNIKIFLNNLKTKFDPKTIMCLEEKKYYDSLPPEIIVYRGMSNKEMESKNFGISWTDNKITAEKYINLKGNNSRTDRGVLEASIQKKDIYTVFYDKGHNEYEIIIVD